MSTSPPLRRSGHGGPADERRVRKTGRGTAVSKATAKTRNGLIAALDIGTTKCCCFIARPQVDRSLRVVGLGHQASLGLRHGVIVDMEAAGEALLNTTHTAAQAVGETVRRAEATTPGGQH